MNTGQRIALIKRLARTLSRESWTDIDLALGQSGLPTGSTSPSDDRYGYCVTRLVEAGDDILRDLDAYLHSPADAAPDDAPWHSDDLRLFLSHVSKTKAYAAQLKARLEWFGIEGFVAHEDIEPTKEWQTVIEAALRSCDACAALLHRDFPASKWCDQELGFALCRKVPVIPVHIDRQPYGFLAKIQSLPGSNLTPAELAPQIARSLLRDARTGPKLTERLVRRFGEARSFEHANTLATMLATWAARISPEQVDRIRQARETNSQVANAWYVDANLAVIETRFGTPATGEPTGLAGGDGMPVAQTVRSTRSNSSR